MISFFTYIEASLLIKLLIAHCLSDFFLQPNTWVANKKNKLWASPYLYLHVLITGLVTWIILWNTHLLGAVAIITITHLFIDGFKSQAEKYFSNVKNADFKLFLADQLTHVTIIVMVWLSIINGWHSWSVMISTVPANYRILLRILGYILVTTPVGYTIQFLTRKWTAELTPNDSLPDAGKWIGILERVLILTMVFINQFSPIGFLVAAKSILRVTDKPDKIANDPVTDRPFSSRKHTEYVLIGTFLSVSIAIAAGLLINILLQIKI